MFNCPHCDAPLGEAERQAGRCRVCGGFLSPGETEEKRDSRTVLLPASPQPETAPSIREIVHSIVRQAQTPGEQEDVPADVPGEPKSPSATVPTAAEQDEPLRSANAYDPHAEDKAADSEDSKAAAETHNRDLDNLVTQLWSESIVDGLLAGATMRASATTSIPVRAGSVRPREVVDLRKDQPRLADYELLDVIGEGGIGVVYAARQTSVDRTVAVKMLRQEMGDEADDREKFLSEAVVTGELEHPNIVPVYDLGRSAGSTLFYSMKRVQGTPWSKAIKQKSLAENLEILMKTADAVAFAHARGVVHRDLKPDNVMLGEFGEVLVMDWGIALTTDRFPKGRLAAHLGLGGSPAYMAPEMVVGPVERIGPASDVYLLGAILFEIVTGHPPHRGNTAIACLQAASRNEIVLSGKSGELFEIAMRAMAAEPADRYPSVTDFQNAVREYRSHAESLVLAARGDAEAAEASRNADYRAFARAMSCYEEALVLWPDNAAAAEALGRTNIAYARCALDKGDFELGLSLLDADKPRHQPLRRRLERALHERETRRQRLVNLKRIAVILLFGMLAGALAAVVMIRAEANRAHTAEQLAQTNLGKAVEAREKTLAALGLLNKKNEELREQKQRVETEKQTALTERERARQAERDANAARDLAVAATAREQQVAYVAQINLADEKIAANAFDQARQQLVGPEAEDKAGLRHWEWGRLMYLLHRDRLTVDLPGEVAALDASADGRLLLAGSAGGSAWLIDSTDGVRLLELDHGAPVRSVAITTDGAWAASGGEGGVVKIWNLNSLRAHQQAPPQEPPKPAAVLPAHSDAVLSLAFSRDGRRLASSSVDRSVQLWNAPQREAQPADGPAWRYAGGLFGHHGPVWSVDFAPDGRRLVSAGDDGSVIVWSADERRRLVRFSEHTGPVYAACFSPDGEQVASAGDDRRILLWRPRDVPSFDYAILLTGAERTAAPYEVLGLHDDAVRSVHFAPDGRLLAAAGDDAALRVWRVAPQSGEPRLVKLLRGHDDRIRCCTFLGGDAAIASGDRGGALKLWDVAGYAEVQVLRGHSGEVYSARYSADGRRLVTAGRDHTAVVWDVRAGRALQTLQEGHAFLAAKALFLPDGTEFLTAAADNSVRLWNVQTGGEVRAFANAGRSGAMALSAGARWMATGGAAQDGAPVCKLWDLETGRLLHVLPHEAVVTAVAFSPQESLLMTGDAEGVRRLWRMESDNETWRLERTLKTHRGGITAAYFLPDGSRVLSASLDHTVGQWDVQTGDEAVDGILKHDDAVTSLAVSLDGRCVLTGTADGQARLWDVAGGAWQPLDTGGARPASVAFSHDGRTALVALEQRGMLLFDVSRPQLAPRGNAPPLAGKPLVLARSAGPVWSAVFSPVGEGLATVSGNRAMLWDVPTGHLVRSFSPHGPVVSARFSPQGDLVATGSWDGSAKIWRLGLAKAAGEPKQEPKPGGEQQARVIARIAGDGVPASIASVAFAPDAQPAKQPRLLLAGSDGVAVLWDVQTAKVLAEFRGHTANVNDAEFSHDGRLVVTASDDGTARVWNAATAQPMFVLAGEQGHEGAVLSAAFSDDGTRVITAGRDATARIWDASDGRRLVTLAGHASAVTSACLSSDNRRALTGSDDRTAKVWLVEPPPEVAAEGETPVVLDPFGGQELLTLRGHDGAVTSVAFSPDGRTVVTASRDGAAMLWHAEDWSDGRAPRAAGSGRPPPHLAMPVPASKMPPANNFPRTPPVRSFP